MTIPDMDSRLSDVPPVSFSTWSPFYDIMQPHTGTRSGDSNLPFFSGYQLPKGKENKKSGSSDMRSKGNRLKRFSNYLRLKTTATNPPPPSRRESVQFPDFTFGGDGKQFTLRAVLEMYPSTHDDSEDLEPKSEPEPRRRSRSRPRSMNPLLHKQSLHGRRVRDSGRLASDITPPGADSLSELPIKPSQQHQSRSRRRARSLSWAPGLQRLNGSSPPELPPLPLQMRNVYET